MNESVKSFSEIVLDLERQQRSGFVETIFCEGKTVDQVKEMVRRLRQEGSNVFGTRADGKLGEELTKCFQELTYNPLSRTFQSVAHPLPILSVNLGIVAAGTADTSVAEEAWATARFYGVEARRFYDVGVAGLHRLLKNLEALRTCDALIVIAGMEGALPSVVAGLVSKPVIACPTSVGYGTHFKGLSPLFAMLNSCAEGVAVVNIDNGFGAACAALRILRK